MLQDEHGFTLVEMLMVCIILGVVLAGIATIFVSGTHSEANLNARFQAQQAARLAVDALRLDAHDACAVNVPSSSKVVLAGVPKVVGSNLSMCGAVASSASYPKITWCALTSPTVSTKYALYRSLATDGSCTASNGKLEADNLTSTVIFATSSTIPVEQLETFSATITVSLQTGTIGAPYTLSEPFTLRNSTYVNTTSTSCSTSDDTICHAGLCPYADLNGDATNAPCYAPVIK